MTASDRKTFYGWAIMGPRGQLLPWSANFLETGREGAFNTLWGSLPRGMSWVFCMDIDEFINAAETRGYRAVRVRLVEVEDTPDE